MVTGLDPRNLFTPRYGAWGGNDDSSYSNVGVIHKHLEGILRWSELGMTSTPSSLTEASILCWFPFGFYIQVKAYNILFLRISIVIYFISFSQISWNWGREISNNDFSFSQSARKKKINIFFKNNYLIQSIEFS